MEVFKLADYIKGEDNNQKIILVVANYVNNNFDSQNRLEIIMFFKNLTIALKGYDDKIIIIEKIEQVSLYK